MYGMAILFQTAKFKSANTRVGGKPPNLMTANISGYTVCFRSCTSASVYSVGYLGIQLNSDLSWSPHNQSLCQTRQLVGLLYRHFYNIQTCLLSFNCTNPLLGHNWSTVLLSGTLLFQRILSCLLYTSPSPRDATLSRMPSSA